MSRFAFLGKMFGAAANDAVDTTIEGIINNFPATATKAQIAMFEDALTKERTKLTEARGRLTKERAEADAAVKAQDTRLAAAQTIRAQRDGTVDEATKAKLNESLTKLVTEIKAKQADVDREKAEAEQAERIVNLREANYKKAFDKVMGAKRALEQGRAAKEAADLELELAREEADAARTAAGLNAQNTSAVDIAGAALNKQAEKARAEAEALRAEAALISASNSTSADNDPVIAAALAAASGKPSASGSVDDELDALLGKR